ATCAATRTADTTTTQPTKTKKIGTAASSKAAKPAGAWTVNDLILAERAGDLVVARDGSLAAWTRNTVAKADGEEKRISNLWLTRLDDGSSVQMTRGSDEVSSPRFSPSGDFVAFLSTRKLPPADEADDKAAADSGDDSDTQVWVIPTDGGESRPLTRFDRDV